MSPGNFFLIGCLIKAIKGLQGHKIRLLVLLSWPDNLTRTRRMTVTRTQGQGWDEDQSNKSNSNYLVATGATGVIPKVVTGEAPSGGSQHQQPPRIWEDATKEEERRQFRDNQYKVVISPVNFENIQNLIHAGLRQA